MSMRQPKNVWLWLLLLTPAIEILLVALVPLRWASSLFHGEAPGLTLAIDNLCVALLYSMALGLWIAWDSPGWWAALGDGILAGIAIAFVNVMIAFAGCTVGAVIFRRA